MKIEIDKILHFLAGYCIASTAILFSPLWLSLSLVLIIAASKEYYDTKKSNPTGFNYYDLFATVLGGCTFAFFYAIFN